MKNITVAVTTVSSNIPLPFPCRAVLVVNIGATPSVAAANPVFLRVNEPGAAVANAGVPLLAYGANVTLTSDMAGVDKMEMIKTISCISLVGGTNLSLLLVE